MANMSNRVEITFAELPQQLQDVYNRGIVRVKKIYKHEILERYSDRIEIKYKVYLEPQAHNQCIVGEYWYKEGDVWHYEVFYH
jgi:hypothetical protein